VQLFLNLSIHNYIMKDIPNLFWKKWLSSDDHEREELIKKLKITKMFSELLYPKFGAETALDAAALMLNGYFEDLAEAIKADGN
jgi:hypothetical protein